MLAISLWQPWASAIALGSKHIETRSWPTKYRGPIAIHAAKRCVKSELIHLSCCHNWTGALYKHLFGQPGKCILALPFGAIVAVCELVDCRPSESFTNGELDEDRFPTNTGIYRWTERGMGDFSLGRYGWVLKNVRALENPTPWKGSQGFFNVDIGAAL